MQARNKIDTGGAAAFLLLGIGWVGSLWIVASAGPGSGAAAYVLTSLFWLALGAGLLYVRAGRVGGSAAEAARLRAIVEQGAVASALLDGDGTLRYISPNAWSILSWTPPAEPDGDLSLLDAIHEDDRRRALKALAELRQASDRVEPTELRIASEGEEDRFIEVWGRNELEDPAVAGLLISFRDITPRKEIESEIERLAYFDSLTELANRRFFMLQGENSMALARRHKYEMAILYLDLDRFKHVNDVLGHEEGDRLLKDVAAALKRSVRETDVVARLGGDEFGVILGEVRDADAAGRVASRVLRNLPTEVRAEAGDVVVGASIGVAVFPDDGEELEELLKAADIAMYRAKADGLGIQFYKPELLNVMEEKLRLEEDLRRAFDHHEFDLYYQPVYSLLTGEMVGAEALSRWFHLTRGLVDASDFIGLAEQSGLIRSLDRWAIASALRHRKALVEHGWRGWIAVNLSRQTLGDPNLVSYVRDVVEDADFEPGALVLEVDEGAAMEDPEATIDLLWELKSLGVALAVDDFGSKAASFSHLKRFPVDILKLHHSFVGGIGAESPDEHLVQATISIAHGIKAKVLAKGVERDDQVGWLRETGCDYVQGYYVGQPVPPQELHEEIGPSRGRAPVPMDNDV